MPKPSITVVDLSDLPADTYVSMAEIGICKICGTSKDLRYGACFLCSEKVSGKKEKDGHLLWETANPRNSWRVFPQ